MNPLIEQLVGQGPVLLDGAWGTQLQARGLESGQASESWNLSHPDRVEEVPRAYVAVGSRIVLTNTFGGSRIMLASHGLAERTAEINQRGAETSKRAAADCAFVFGSMGPCGKLLMTGDVTEEEMEQAFTEQAQALADGGVDGIVIETMSDLAEAKVAISSARRTGLPIVACMVFDSGKDKDRTMMGIAPEQAAETLTEAGADVVGANCGQGIAGFVPICRRMHAATDRPIWMKPNAGLPKIVDGAVVYTTRPEEFAAHGPALIEAGANFIGGCCGTGPDFLRALASAISS